MRRLKHQSGVALITALLIVSLATILATSLLNHLHYDTRRTENILRLDQAQMYNTLAVEFGMNLLRLEKSNNDYDSLQEYSKDNAQLYPVPGGKISAFIIDLQSCFNLNNLSETNSQIATHKAIYRSLLEQAGIDGSIHNSLIDSLTDWLDADDESQIHGAEFDYYIGLDRPYRTANSLMVSPSELQLVKGYTAEVIDVIEPHICVLPSVNSAININTASFEMLESIPGLSGYGETIYKDLHGDLKNPDDDAPFATLDDFKAKIKTLEIKGLDTTGLQVYSEFFLMESNTQLGAGNVKIYSMIYRNQSDGSTELIRQTRGTL